ncbi:MAG: hypothetical protein WC539_08860 [Nitrospirota bacterium]
MINWAHIHLIINHVPAIGTMGAFLLLCYALVKKSEDVKVVSLWAFLLVALITIPVYLTGNAAADVVKNLPGVTEAYIGRHEEVAFFALFLAEIAGIVALAGLILFRRLRTIPNWIIVLVLILSLMSAVVIGFTANLGGEIRHTEIRM